MKTIRAWLPLLACLLAAGRCAAATEVAPPAAAAERTADAEAAEPAAAASAATPLTVAPPVRWAASGAPDDGGYRLSLSRGAVDLGLRFESRVAAAHPIDARSDSAAPPGATLPAVSIGLRSVSPGPASAGSLAERALGSTTAVPYVSKMGIEWKPAQSQVFFHQGLGVRLGGDDRLIMRLRKGSLGIYMQRNF